MEEFPNFQHPTRPTQQTTPEPPHQKNFELKYQQKQNQWKKYTRTGFFSDGEISTSSVSKRSWREKKELHESQSEYKTNHFESVNFTI
jgi:hypothetical protein